MGPEGVVASGIHRGEPQQQLVQGQEHHQHHPNHLAAENLKELCCGLSPRKWIIDLTLRIHWLIWADHILWNHQVGILVSGEDGCDEAHMRK